MTKKSNGTERKTKMASLKEEATAYEAPKTKNIADLDMVGVDIEVEEKTAVDKDGKEFTYKYIVENGEEYRVPNTVLEQLQTQLKNNPDMQAFKVDKAGSGLATKYTVVVLK